MIQEYMVLELSHLILHQLIYFILLILLVKGLRIQKIQLLKILQKKMTELLLCFNYLVNRIVQGLL